MPSASLHPLSDMACSAQPVHCLLLLCGLLAHRKTGMWRACLVPQAWADAWRHLSANASSGGTGRGGADPAERRAQARARSAALAGLLLADPLVEA